MAGVGCLPYQKAGKDFLAASHFRIGMDESFLSEVKQNTHKLDYPTMPSAGLADCRPAPAKLPDGANVMHTTKIEGLPISATKESFKHLGEVRRPWQDYSGRLNTNFLSHCDDQLLNFTTSAEEHFNPELALQFDPREQKSLMNSSVPNGDVIKEPIPNSEVRGNFVPHSVDHIEPSRFPNYRQPDMRDTLRTDRRAPGTYSTTHKEMHDGVFKPASVQQYGSAAVTRGTHTVPTGDLKGLSMSTNVRDDYTPQAPQHGRYDKQGTVAAVLGTTLSLGSEREGAGTLGDVISHTGDVHSGTTQAKVQHAPMNKFHSDLPNGDRHPGRTKVLQNDTAYGEHYPNRAPGIIVNPKVIGAKLMTKSQVVMGTDNEVLSASTKSCYVTQQPQPINRVDQTYKFKKGFSLGSSSYKEPEKSIIQEDFPTHSRYTKFIPPNVAMHRLKESHVILPNIGGPLYDTSYGQIFYSKKPDPQPMAPQLQTSTVPMGTFSRYRTSRN